MKHRRFLALASVAACLAAAVSAGWLWQSLSPTRFESSARLAVTVDPAANAAGDKPADIDEAQILSPEVLSTAALLIADRNVPLSLNSPFDSVTDYLLDRTHVGRPEQDAPEQILITCTAASAAESLQMLSAVVDAYLDAATTAQPARTGTAAEESPTIELQTECEQLAQAIEQKQQGIAEVSAQLEAAKAVASGSAGNDPIVLEGELVQARRASSDAAQRLAAARQDVEKKLPLEMIAARIADIPTRTRALQRLNQAKIKNDLSEQAALHQRWSAIYGRNHPRMAELRQHIESLEKQIGQISSDERQSEQSSQDRVGQHVEHGQPADGCVAPAIVLTALENEAGSLKTAEQALETRLAAAQQRLQQQQELESRLGDARQELEFLQAEHGRLWKQIDSARRSETNALATVIEPPGLSQNAIAPQAGLQMAVACVSGMALCLLVLWQFRRASPAGAAKDDSPQSPKHAASGRDRFRSHEEQQLMRLKLQSAR